MKKILLSCDFMGFKPNLFIDGDSMFRSTCTGILSILIVLISLLCAGYFGSELILRSVPTVVISRDIYDDFGPLPLSNKDFFFLFAMEYGNNSYYVDPTVFSVEGNAYVMRNFLNETTGLTETEFTSKKVKIDVCSKFYTDDDIIEKNMKLPLDMFYCAEPNQFNLTGYWASKSPYGYFKIDFNKCQNSTDKNFTCKSPQEIDSIVQGGYISIKYTTYEIDQLNYLLPIKRVFYDDYNLLNSDSSLEYAIQIELLKFQSDNGLVMQDKQVDLGLSQNIKIFTKIAKSKNIFTATFQGNFAGTTYKRSYIKLQSVMTQIGGFIKAVMLLGYAFSYIISKNYYFVNLVNQFVFVEKNQNRENSERSFTNNFNSTSNTPRTLPRAFKSISKSKRKDPLEESSGNIKNSNIFRSTPKNIKKRNSSRSTDFLKNQLKVIEITPPSTINLKSGARKNSKIQNKDKNKISNFTDYLLNLVMICTPFRRKSSNFKFVYSFIELYKRVLSVETLFRKCYDTEYLKYSLQKTNPEFAFPFSNNLVDTLMMKMEKSGIYSKEENFIFN
jgi:hypothetical protein